MKIKIDPHTLERAGERGASPEEIRDVIENGFPLPTRKGRLAKGRVFRFEKKRLGKFYRHKRVEVIYTLENDAIITVTVYAFYGEWTDDHADSL